MALAPKSQRLFFLAAAAAIVTATFVIITSQQANSNRIRTSQAKSSVQYEMTPPDMQYMEGPDEMPSTRYNVNEGY